MDAIQDTLRDCELFQGMEPDFLARVVALAQRQSLPKGEYLFLLGDHADRLCIVLSGKIEVCMPLSVGGAVKDVAVRMIERGGALGLSAMVKPYRFTLSARAAEKSELASYGRSELLGVLDTEPRLGRFFMGRLAEVLGRRFLTMQALWGRELQRSLSGAKSSMSERSA